MEMPLRNPEPEKVPTPKKIMEDFALEMYGVEKACPIKVLTEFLYNEDLKPALRANIAFRLMDKIYPTPKTIDEGAEGGLSVSILGAVNITVSGATNNNEKVVAIDGTTLSDS